MNEEQMIEFLQNVFNDRPIFHCEEEFRLVLYRKLIEIYGRHNTFMEHRYPGEATWVDLFIRLEDGSSFSIELKYKHREGEIDNGIEIFRLKPNTNHVGFINDIDYLANAVQQNNFTTIGFAICLTDLEYLWQINNCWNGDDNIMGQWIPIDNVPGDNIFKCFCKTIAN